MTFPKNITPSPLKEAAVEIRFDSSLPADAVFGVVYSSLMETYTGVENLPILQLPETIRNRDENLIFQPHHKLKREKFVAQIGPRVFSLSMIPPLTSWSEFLPELVTVFDKIGKARFISNVTRLGLRYINHFEGAILGKLNLELSIMGNSIEEGELYIRNTFPHGDFSVLLQIVNFTELREKIGNDVKKYSAIDTDVSVSGNNLDFFSNIESLLNNAHMVQKETFFGLLKDDFLQTMKPEYQ